MKFITWQFVRGTGLVSWLISWKNDAQVSHVNVVTPDGKLLGALQKGGVQIRQPNYDKWKIQILVLVPVTDEQYDKFWAFVNSKVGAKYDEKGILGIAFGNNLQNKSEFFCSELQAAGIKEAGIATIAKDASKIDPDTLRLILTAVEGAREVHVQ